MTVEEIRKLVEELNLRVPKKYQDMDVNQLSNHLRETMSYEHETFEKIEEFEKNGVETDLTNYAKMILKNTTGREIIEIQEVYLKKIDSEYLKSK